ncbi:MAG: CoB--CoM heterodisulfide reductase iron-sulfur subunit B family protein [Pseudomonadota bacterium]
MKYAFYPGCSYKAAAGYKESVDAVTAELGLELTELTDWNCCGATVYLSLDKVQALALTARVFALARQAGFDQVVTICNACYTTLRKGLNQLERDGELLAEINRRLAPEGLEFSPRTRIRHLLDVMVNDLGLDLFREKKRPSFQGGPAAAYYGCQLTRPWGDLDHPDRPRILEDFLEACGFTAVDSSAKTLCCGASHRTIFSDACRPLIARIVRGFQARGADLAVTVCPLCQFNLDAGQAGLGLPPLPVIYFTQAAGLALGISPTKLGLNKLLIPLKRFE